MAGDKIRVSTGPNGLALQAEAVTETFAVLGLRGSGKTHSAAVLVEGMLDAGAQVVVIDPLDAWWGLRSSADGTGPGKAVYVFGGDHADAPLEATAGHLVADVIVDSGVSVVLSLRHLSKGNQRRFVADFAERLYHRKGEVAHRTPLHVVVDEADSVCPQRVTADVARAHGAIDDLVRRGRSSGIGVTCITQRPAVLSKDVLTQSEALVCHRLVAPQDRKALDAWVEAHDPGGLRAEFMGSLASLAVGEAWVWSPGWLDVFKRVKVRGRSTFDSSFTPKPGARRLEPTARAEVDLGWLAEVCERHEATLDEFDTDSDHAHLLVTYPPKVSLSKLVGSLKTNSSKQVRAQGWPEVRQALWGEHFWSPSYAVVSCGGAPLAIIAEYVQNQGRRPRRPGRPPA